MKISIKLCAMLMVAFMVFSLSISVSADYKLYSANNLVDEKSATFEGGIGKWEKGLDVTPKPAPGKGLTGDAMLCGPRTNSWDTAYFDVTPIILANGVGFYSFSAYVKAVDAQISQMAILFRDDKGGFGFDTSPQKIIKTDYWTLLSVKLDVVKVDKESGTYTINLGSSADPAFMDLQHTMSNEPLFMAFSYGAGAIYVDNVCIVNLDKLSNSSSNSSQSSETQSISSVNSNPVSVAVNTNEVSSEKGSVDKSNTNSSLIGIVLVLSGVVLVGTALALFFIKPKKKSVDNSDQS